MDHPSQLRIFALLSVTRCMRYGLETIGFSVFCLPWLDCLQNPSLSAKSPLLSHANISRFSSACKPIPRLVFLPRPLPIMWWHGMRICEYYGGVLFENSHLFRNAVIIGPADTPFEDGTFRLVMNFEEQYPNKPPGVKFISQMFHPNVYGTGELCLDILQNRWSPTYDVAAILTSIQR